MAPRPDPVSLLPPGVLAAIGWNETATAEAARGLSRSLLRLRTIRGSFALRVCRPDTAEIPASIAAAGLGLGPAVVHADRQAGVLLSEWADGAALSRDGFADPGLCRAAGAVLRAFQDKAPPLGAPADAAATLAGYEAAALAIGRSMPASPRLREALESALSGQPAASVPSHGDPGPANWIVTPGGLRLIDWEFAGMREPAWDLACLAEEADLSDPALEAVLAGYGASDGIRRRLAGARLVVAATAAAWALLQPVEALPPGYAAARLARAEALAA